MSISTYALVLFKTIFYLLGTLTSSFRFLKVRLDVDFIKLMHSLREIRWIYLWLRTDLNVQGCKTKLGVKIKILEVRLADSMDMDTQQTQAKMQLELLVLPQLLPLVPVAHQVQNKNLKKSCNKSSNNKKTWTWKPNIIPSRTILFSNLSRPLSFPLSFLEASTPTLSLATTPSTSLSFSYSFW